MKDIQEVIRLKESQIQQLLKEIEALKTAAALLNDPGAGRDQTGNGGAVAPRPVAVAEGGSRSGAASPKRWP